MNTVIAAFTNKGVNLALRLAEFLGGEVFAPERFVREGVNVLGSLTEWAGKMFRVSRAIIFVSACGIAVRAVAPHVRDKMTDPAVVAVDEWAVQHDCVIENPERIKSVSSRVLEGGDVGVAVTWENIPAPFPVTLVLRPKVLVLGAGCNRGVDPAEFESSAMDFLNGAGVSVLSLRAVASIDMKRDEAAMRIFAERHNIVFMTFKASELNAVEGDFTASERVRRFTGTDNVCERACVLCAGEGGVLMRSKTVYNGMTFALARSEI